MISGAERIDEVMVKTTAKQMLRNAFRAIGVDIYRWPPRPGFDLTYDIRRLASPAATVFDVGANKGQSIRQFRALFPEAVIHAFEPNPAVLSVAAQSADARVVLNGFALGESPGELEFNIYEWSDLSSFLQPAAENWSGLGAKQMVEIRTLDSYCEEAGVTGIDMLKSDTQGFDAAVLRGGAAMIEAKRIKVIKIELTFMDLYEGQEQPMDTLKWLLDRGYSLIGFYEQQTRNGRLGWLDALLIA